MTWAKALAFSSLIVLTATVTAQEINVGGLKLRKDQAEAPSRNDYNVMLGDLALAVRYVGYTTYDDNPNLSPDQSHFSGTVSQSEEDSWMLSNGLDVLFDFPITPWMVFHGDFLIEYLTSLEGDQNDGWQLGGSQIFGNNDATFAVDLIRTDRHLLTISDTISREQSVIDLNLREHATDITYWSNTAAAQYEYAISPLLDLGLYYGYKSTWTDEDSRNYLDYKSHIVSVKLGYQANPDLTINPFFTWEHRNYEDNSRATLRGMTEPSYVYTYTFANNDLDEYTIGADGTYKLSPTTELDYAVGWQLLEYGDSKYVPAADDPIHETVIHPASDSGSSPFATLTLKNELTATYIHSLSLGYTLNPILSPEVNYSRDLEAGYDFDWKFHWYWRLEGGFTYIYSDQSDDQGATNQTFQEYLALTYIISPKATVALVYERNDQQSNQRAQEYTQNRVGLHWTYKF